MNRKTIEHLAPPAAVVSVLGILGVTGHLGSGNVSTTGTRVSTPDALTATQLKDWPKAESVRVKVAPYQGAQAIGKEVDPEVYTGPDSDAETSANLTEVVQAQAPGNFLQEGQYVTVPDIHPDIPSANPDDPNIQPAG